MSAAKALVAAVGVVVTALTGVLADDVVDVNEVALLVAVLVEAAATVYAVWRVPNEPADDGAGEVGYGLIEVLLAVFLIIVIVFVLMRLL